MLSNAALAALDLFTLTSIDDQAVLASKISKIFPTLNREISCRKRSEPQKLFALFDWTFFTAVAFHQSTLSHSSGNRKFP
jgi:hypothetical protein